jgi:hypothetical protein
MFTTLTKHRYICNMKKAKLLDHEFMVPETIQEAINTMGHKECYDLFLKSYMQLQTKISKGWKPREQKWVKISLSSLDQKDRETLLTLARSQKVHTQPEPQTKRTVSRKIQTQSENHQPTESHSQHPESA